MARVSSGKDSKQNYATPWSFIGAVEAIHGKIVFDLAADALNRKSEQFFSEITNALVQDWLKIPVEHGELLWLNPPFNDIAPWAEKCAHFAQHATKGQIAFLVPASVGSNWFRDHVFGSSRVRFLNGRIPFDPEKPTWGYPKDCLLALFGPPPKPVVSTEIWLPSEYKKVDIWDWRISVPPELRANPHQPRIFAR